MPNVPWPPDGQVDDHRTDFNTCVQYVNDPLTFTFKDAGMIFPTALGIFTPDILPGINLAGTMGGPYYPINNHTHLDVYYWDFAKAKLYKDRIIICTKCNSPKDPKCAYED
jgi:hypothetical protein